MTDLKFSVHHRKLQVFYRKLQVFYRIDDEKHQKIEVNHLKLQHSYLKLQQTHLKLQVKDTLEAMPPPKGNQIQGLHVGALVRAEAFRQRMTHAMLGRLLRRNQSTVKSFLMNSTMQAYLIWELSVALRHNFFADLARQLDAATEGRLDSEQTELQQLKAEYQRLKEERDYLRKALDMLNPRT